MKLKTTKFGNSKENKCQNLIFQKEIGDGNNIFFKLNMLSRI